MPESFSDFVSLALSSIAPVSVRLAQHLQTKRLLSFSAAWTQLMRMLPSQPNMSFQSHDDSVYSDLTSGLQEIETYFATHYSVNMTRGSAQALLHEQARLPIEFIAWNVRGLQSSMPAVRHILGSIRPLLLIMTETHLLARQSSAPWLKSLMHDYKFHATCFPDRNPLALGPQHASPISAPSRNRAGVLIATRKAYIQHQHVSGHSVPSSLKGYLQHVSIHSPHSHSLHVVGAYCPPHSSSAGFQVQADIFDYISHLQPRLTSAGSRLLLAGDLNVVMSSHHMVHRSIGRLNAMDCRLAICRLVSLQTLACYRILTSHTQAQANAVPVALIIS